MHKLCCLHAESTPPTHVFGAGPIFALLVLVELGIELATSTSPWGSSTTSTRSLSSLVFFCSKFLKYISTRSHRSFRSSVLGEPPSQLADSLGQLQSLVILHTEQRLRFALTPFSTRAARKHDLVV